MPLYHMRYCSISPKSSGVRFICNSYKSIVPVTLCDPCWCYKTTTNNPLVQIQDTDPILSSDKFQNHHLPPDAISKYSICVVFVDGLPVAPPPENTARPRFFLYVFHQVEPCMLMWQNSKPVKHNSCICYIFLCQDEMMQVSLV